MKISIKLSRGFILPLSLWIIAVMGLAAAVLSEWVAGAVNNAIAIQNKADSELAFANIRNELIFAFGRQPMTFRGVAIDNLPEQGSSLDPFSDILNNDFDDGDTIILDGRISTVSSNPRYAIKIQDGRGLVNLNVANNTILKRFFTSLNIDETLHDSLIDTLLDYRDEDDLTRLSGAEINDYDNLGLSHPANFQLLTPLEAQRIIGWSAVSEIWESHYRTPILTTCRSNGFNPNTAPPIALQTYIEGLSSDTANLIITARETYPFRNIQDIGNAAGLILVAQPFFYSFVPGLCFIVDLIDRETNETIRFSLTLLRREPDQPWQIDYVYKIPKVIQQRVADIDPKYTFPKPEDIARGAD